MSEYTVNAAQLLELEIDKIPTLVDPILPSMGIVALIGTSDIGKSTLLLQLCKDVVLGESFIGFPITATHKSTIYVSTEDDPFSLSYRLKKLNGSEEEKLKNMRFIFTYNNLYTSIDSALREQPADVVVIDTFSDVYPGDMNQINKVRNFMNDFYDLAIIHQCLIILNHHTGKYTEEKPPSKNNSIGSAGFEGKARMVMELRQDYEDETKRHLCIVKGNYLPASYKSRSFELEFDIQNGFAKTGNRKDFSELAKPKVTKPAANRIVEKEVAVKLKKEGKSVREIEAIMREKGYTVSKSTIAEWVKDVSRDNSVNEDMDTAQD